MLALRATDVIGVEEAAGGCVDHEGAILSRSVAVAEQSVVDVAAAVDVAMENEIASNDVRMRGVVVQVGVQEALIVV